MTCRAHALVTLILLAGCQGKGQVFENPVVGPPPPRISNAEATVAAQNPTVLDEAAGVKQTSFASVSSDTPVPITGRPGEVAARVNGRPIFVSQVLQPYAPKLAAYRARLSDDEFRRLQLAVIKQDLPHYIETAAVVDAVMSELDSAQKEAIEEQLDAIFQEELAELMRKAGAESIAELQAMLAEAGSSLAVELQLSGETLTELRKSFGDRALSAQYIRESIGEIPPPTRHELLAEYRSRISEFARPARVKWQQLELSYARHGGPEQAARILPAIQADLQAGMPFDDVVRKYSDGPLAQVGGHWDWTQPESIADDALREALATLEEGVVSEPIRGAKALLIVKVTCREAARTADFAEVQAELRTQISERKRKERIAAVLAEIKSRAVIETMFDDLPAGEERQVSPESATKTAASQENSETQPTPP